MTSLVRIGRPTFLRGTALGLLLGALVALPVAVAVVVADYPEWGQTLLSLLLVVACFYLVALAVRLLLHLGFTWIDRGLPSAPEHRAAGLAYTDPVLRVSAGAAGAGVVLAVTYLLGTGEVLG